MGKKMSISYSDFPSLKEVKHRAQVEIEKEREIEDLAKIDEIGNRIVKAIKNGRDRIMIHPVDLPSNIDSFINLLIAKGYAASVNTNSVSKQILELVITWDYF